MLSSIAWKPRPTTTIQTGASPLGVAPDAVVAAGCPHKPMLFPAPGPWPPAPGFYWSAYITIGLRRM